MQFLENIRMSKAFAFLPVNIRSLFFTYIHEMSLEGAPFSSKLYYCFLIYLSNCKYNYFGILFIPLLSFALRTQEIYEWTCATCGFRNKGSNKVCGGMGQLGCKRSRKGGQLPSVVFHASNGGGSENGSWVCSCGFQNKAKNRICGGIGNLGNQHLSIVTVIISAPEWKI